MTTIEINNTMTEQEENELNLDARPEFKIETETGDKAIATVGKIATVTIRANHFEKDLEERKETAAEILAPLTNIQIMQALTFMTYKKENSLNKLPAYVAELATIFNSGEPMEFFPFIKNEEELREYLKELLGSGTDEHLNEYGDQYIYSALGTLFLNL